MEKTWVGEGSGGGEGKYATFESGRRSVDQADAQG